MRELTRDETIEALTFSIDGVMNDLEGSFINQIDSVIEAKLNEGKSSGEAFYEMLVFCTEKLEEKLIGH